MKKVLPPRMANMLRHSKIFSGPALSKCRMGDRSGPPKPQRARENFNSFCISETLAPLAPVELLK
ncbi:hypothetical protein Hanom_Chr08g00716531 [Helianthus anomalus]